MRIEVASVASRLVRSLGVSVGVLLLLYHYSSSLSLKSVDSSFFFSSRRLRREEEGVEWYMVLVQAVCYSIGQYTLSYRVVYCSDERVEALRYLHVPSPSLMTR